MMMSNSQPERKKRSFSLKTISSNNDSILDKDPVIIDIETTFWSEIKSDVQKSPIKVQFFQIMIESFPNFTSKDSEIFGG